MLKRAKNVCWCVVKVFHWLMDKYHNRKCLKLTIPRYGRNTPTLRFLIKLNKGSLLRFDWRLQTQSNKSLTLSERACTLILLNKTLLIMKYTLDELRHLRNIRALGFNNDLPDDQHGTKRDFFKSETEKFFDWLEKMEKTNRIKDMLK